MTDAASEWGLPNSELCPACGHLVFVSGTPPPLSARPECVEACELIEVVITLESGPPTGGEQQMADAIRRGAHALREAREIAEQFRDAEDGFSQPMGRGTILPWEERATERAGEKP